MHLLGSLVEECTVVSALVIFLIQTQTCINFFLLTKYQNIILVLLFVSDCFSKRGIPFLRTRAHYVSLISYLSPHKKHIIACRISIGQRRS